MIIKIISYFLYYIFSGTSAARFQGVKVGNKCRIFIKNFGSEPYLIEIGNNVTIAAGTRILTHDGSLCLVSDEKGRRYSYKKVKIADNIFIGVNSIILYGVNVCSNVIIGAGSVVSKNITEPGVYVGVPARKIKDFNDFHESHLACLSDCDIQKHFNSKLDKKTILGLYNVK
ncbi:acyltransferase [Aliivibrio fischeri]|uniref:acyltransferase n=1 Tax=Aliivibrio fischeri TaxID=668 RepID=UPI0012D96B70|nr:acyltransferase [Aliivibrio fischeri]MUK26520.1 acyltransferase [Aliivibrio fischeri]MUK33718.1 acyltransferase [Aliivibrio fischeri]